MTSPLEGRILTEKCFWRDEHEQAIEIDSDITTLAATTAPADVDRQDKCITENQWKIVRHRSSCLRNVQMSPVS